MQQQEGLQGEGFYNENLGFSFVLPLEDCETEISITGGISGDSLRQRNQLISEICVVQDLISV